MARKKRRFWRNYWLDILAVMPMIRAFRLLRLLRILRLLRAGILLNRSLGRLSCAIALQLKKSLHDVIQINDNIGCSTINTSQFSKSKPVAIVQLPDNERFIARTRIDAAEANFKTGKL